jgi:hypothetical protein
MEVTFVFYILISVIVISGSVYFGSGPGSRSGSFVMAICFLLVSILFGMRWFTTSGASNIGTNVSTTWPPPNSINVCPDYTTMTSSTPAAGTSPIYTCTDTSRVATVASLGGPAQIVLNRVVPGSPTVYMRPTADLCNECYTKGLTWEGVCTANSKAPVNATVVPPSPA